MVAEWLRRRVRKTRICRSDSYPHLMNTQEVQTYLKNKLKNSARYSLSEDDKKIIENLGIEEYIYKKLTSKNIENGPYLKINK